MQYVNHTELRFKNKNQDFTCFSVKLYIYVCRANNFYLKFKVLLLTQFKLDAELNGERVHL